MRQCWHAKLCNYCRRNTWLNIFTLWNSMLQRKDKKREFSSRQLSVTNVTAPVIFSWGLTTRLWNNTWTPQLCQFWPGVVSNATWVHMIRIASTSKKLDCETCETRHRSISIQLKFKYVSDFNPIQNLWSILNVRVEQQKPWKESSLQNVCRCVQDGIIPDQEVTA